MTPCRSCGIDLPARTGMGRPRVYCDDCRDADNRATLSSFGCPECEGIGFRVLFGGRDAMGQPIRSKRCLDCGTIIATVEIRVDGWTASQLCDDRRLSARVRNRIKFGYKASTAGRAPISRWVRSSIEVISDVQASRGPAARALRAQGMTYQAIADRLGVSKHTVYEHCHGRAKDGAPAIPREDVTVTVTGLSYDSETGESAA